MPDRRTPLYDVHLRAGAKMVKGGGDFMFPAVYTNVEEEHTNTRTYVGLQDLSTMGEVDVKGPGAERLINHLLVNEVRDLQPGQVRYSTMCNADGGVIDDVTVYKFSDEHFMVVTSSGPRKKSARWIADQAVGTGAYVSDITAAVALPVVQGPRSRDFLKTVAEGADLDSLKYFRFTTGRILSTDLIISRSGYTGELGYELYTPAEEAAEVWEHLVQKGREFGLQPYGVLAMQSLRLEKGYPLYGNDVNENVTPFHVGLDRWIRFDKRDFIGRDALLKVQDEGLAERWVGLVLQGQKAASFGDKVYSIGDINAFRAKMFSGAESGAHVDVVSLGEEVGHVTFSGRGYTVGKVLALAYVKTTHSWPGNKLLIGLGGKPVLATVTLTPFFDPQGARLRA